MAARDQLIAVWSTGLPAGTTGTTFAAGDTVATKIAAIATWTVAQGFSNPTLVTPSTILNTVVPADLAALSQLATLQLSMILSGSLVDASVGTTVRAAIQNIFAGKSQTLTALAALADKYDNPRIPWWQSVGFQSQVCVGDAVAAGLT